MIHKFRNIKDACMFSVNHQPIGNPLRHPFIFADNDEISFMCGDSDDDQQSLFDDENLWMMFPEDVEDRLNTIRLDLKGN